MASSKPPNTKRKAMPVDTAPRTPRILLAASGSVAALKFAHLCRCFSEWTEVRAVATKSSLRFIDGAELPKNVIFYTDEYEWESWNGIGDSVLHIELRRWADIMVIAPLSANTLGKIAVGVCDNLLTCIVRDWDYSKPLFVAPAMNTFMWNNLFTKRHLKSTDELGITLISPASIRLACGGHGKGAMAETSLIYSTVRLFAASGNKRVMEPANSGLSRPRILLAASGSVAALEFANLCHHFSEWTEVRAVATKSSLHFIDRAALPEGVIFYTDEDDWGSWIKIGDPILHIELRRWADIMVIAPLSANTLGKIANGLCDNLLTCIVRAWDYSKPLFVAPAMNTFMWTNPLAERHLHTIDDDLGITLIPPDSKTLACGHYVKGIMAEHSLIYSTVRLFAESMN